MFLELIAVIVAGFAGAGAMMLLVRTVRVLPRWLVPVAAGGAMLAATISMEYGWYARTKGSLPDGLAVAQSVQGSAPWRPWTYAVPMTERFVAIDLTSLRANTRDEGLLMADLYFFGRWRPVHSVEVIVDCAGGRRADPAMGDDSPPVWREVGPDDPILRTVCGAV